ncbi:hypothetical protein SLS56_001177 [Neofusicoccum ribis]|uniref:Uncharacterized protein n=1 Tax=Neofusicoccum ribis TaxID=45134 RepID=A0ABR3TB10_9PEZI
MAKAIARSKSMTLKRSKRSTPYMDQPLPVSNPQFLGSDAEPRDDHHNLEKVPPKRADSGTASASGDEMPRPRTANSAIERSRALHTTGQPIVVQADEQTFDFPTPSPEAVYQSREKLHRDQTLPIGMALGSPSHNNANAWKQSHPAPKEKPNPSTANVDTTFDAAAADPAGRPPTSDGKKVKVSRWKSLFGRRPADKPPATPAPFYQLQVSQAPAVPAAPARTGTQDDATQSRADLGDNEKSKGGKAEEKKSKGRSRSKSSAAADARAATLPLDLPKMPTAFPEQGSPKVPPKDQQSPEKKKPSRFGGFGGFHHKETRPQLTRAETSPMLNVDIPTIEMERYSVMFGSLLKGDRQSNLLMRRQGNPERLKPLNSDSLRVQSLLSSFASARITNPAQVADRNLAKQGDDEDAPLPKPTRRATSPATPTFQTPTFTGLSLFPRDSMSDSRAGSPAPARGQSPAPAKNLNLPKSHHRLQRSFTAPISPSRPTFGTDGNDAPSTRERPVLAKHITEEPEHDGDFNIHRNELISPAFTVSTRDSEASFETIESNETAIRIQDKRMRSKFNSDLDESAWEIVTKKQQPNLQVQTAVAQGSFPGPGSGSGSTLSLQSQSPLSSLSGQSFAQAKETIARQNSLREKQRQQQLREREQGQSPTVQAPIRAPSPKADQQGRKPSYASSHGSDKHQGEQARDKDAEMMLQQQQQFRERKQKQMEEQQQQQPQPQHGGPRRQPTLKERAEEVQNAARVAIARQVSISRQRAQQEMLRAQKAAAASHNTHNATNGIGMMTISSNQKSKSSPADSHLQSPSTTSLSSPADPATPPSASQIPTPTLVIPDDDAKPKLARQESLRRAGRAVKPTVIQSPTGERLVEKRTLTPVLVDIPNRKSVVGNIVDE